MGRASPLGDAKSVYSRRDKVPAVGLGEQKRVRFAKNLTYKGQR